MMVYNFGECPMDNCVTRKTPPDPHKKPGKICFECNRVIAPFTVQLVFCKLCGRAYYFRDRLYIKEPECISLGLCVWCKERLKWEKEQLEKGYITEDELTKFPEQKYFEIIANTDEKISCVDDIFLTQNMNVDEDGNIIKEEIADEEEEEEDE